MVVADWTAPPAEAPEEGATLGLGASAEAVAAAVVGVAFPEEVVVALFATPVAVAVCEEGDTFVVADWAAAETVAV
jgi:hypothetical protein